VTPKEQIDAYIAAVDDWRGPMLAKIRQTILAADPEIYEDWKWMGSPVWYRDGIIGVANHHKGKVKLTFSYGAFLPDPAKLFNAGLEGNERRAIDLFETDKLSEPALTALVRAAVDYNQAKTAARKTKPKKA
jgi:hypothetical protein